MSGYPEVEDELTIDPTTTRGREGGREGGRAYLGDTSNHGTDSRLVRRIEHKKKGLFEIIKGREEGREEGREGGRAYLGEGREGGRAYLGDTSYHGTDSRLVRRVKHKE